MSISCWRICSSSIFFPRGTSMPLLDEQFHGRREAAERFALDALLKAIAPAGKRSEDRETEPFDDVDGAS